jgi:putative lipoprotein
MDVERPAGGPSPGRGRTVRGEVNLPEVDLPPAAAAMVITVQDVSRADAPSIVVAEQRIDQVELAAGRAIPFAVEVPPELDERATYVVQAHIDISGSGEVEIGDLVSTQSHPVLTRGAKDVVVVPVRRV